MSSLPMPIEIEKVTVADAIFLQKVKRVVN